MTAIFTQLCVLSVMAAAASGPGAADDDPRAWLQKMSSAVEYINYEGTFVHVIDGNMVETFRIVHKVSEDGRVSERLSSLNGSGREIIRNDDEVKCILEGDKSVVVKKRESSPLLSSLPVYQRELDDLYHFKAVGRERVANRDTRKIEVHPRDEFRYGHRLWLDERTAMPLRSALIDNSGRIVEQVFFTSISLRDDIPDEALQQRLSADGYIWHVEESEIVQRDARNDADWQAESLPRGFKLTVARTHDGDEQTVDHYVYTDGLASVSVFVEPRKKNDEPMTGLSTIGSTNAYATTVGEYQVTAVGEVPPSTVEMIGASLRRKK